MASPHGFEHMCVCALRTVADHELVPCAQDLFARFGSDRAHLLAAVQNPSANAQNGAEGLDARLAMLFATPCATPTLLGDRMRRHRSLRSTEPHHLGQRLLGSPCPVGRFRDFAAAAASTAASAFRIGQSIMPAATFPTLLCEATARLCRRPSATFPPPFCDFAAASAEPHTTNSNPASSSSLPAIMAVMLCLLVLHSPVSWY